MQANRGRGSVWDEQAGVAILMIICLHCVCIACVCFKLTTVYVCARARVPFSPSLTQRVAILDRWTYSLIGQGGEIPCGRVHA